MTSTAGKSAAKFGARKVGHHTVAAGVGKAAGKGFSGLASPFTFIGAKAGQGLLKVWGKNVLGQAGSKFLATKVGQLLAHGLNHIVGAGTGGIGYIVTTIITIVVMITCFACSTGVNDLFSVSTAFSIDWDGETTDDPNLSYGADTIVALDAFLSRNYEYMCKRGLEDAIKDNFGTADSSAPVMSAKAPFTVKLTRGVLQDPLNTDTGTGEESSEPASTMSSGEYKFEAGRVSIVQHRAEEKFSAAGADLSVPDRYVIYSINGCDEIKFSYDSTSKNITIAEADAKAALSASHPGVIERYVYDVESKNSIFYTDYDHTIVPNIHQYLN